MNRDDLRPEPRATARAVLAAIASVAAASVAVAGLQQIAGVPNASAVYLLAAALVALFAGRTGAVITAVLAFLAYDFFFIEPVFTFTVRDPGEWLNLTLLLVIGLLVGQLAALLRARAEDARDRELEARALFEVSRELALRDATGPTLVRLAERLRQTPGLARVWITADGGGRTRRLADTGGTLPLPETSRHLVLRHARAALPERWDVINTTPPRADPAAPRTETAAAHEPGRPAAHRETVLRIALETSGRSLGSLWATSKPGGRPPVGSAARLLATAADQIAQVLEQDRLAADAREAEIARRSDALKTALLESVSHDLRTPLASIRAAAGSLLDGTLHLSDEDRRASAEAIDREAEHLNQIVTNLLDLSRIEAGELRADREIYDLEDAIESTLARARPALAGRLLDFELDDVPPVSIDAVFFDRVLVNLLENAARYTPPGTRIRIRATADDEAEAVRLTIEDAGPGVPPASLPHLFEKFYRVPGRRSAARTGTGIGLSVVRGLAEAMGGHVTARASELGGLAVDVDLQAARVTRAVP